MLTLLISLAALAAPQATTNQPPTLRVRYSDLDLTRPSGRRLLDRRLARAVEKLCPTNQIGQSTPALTGLRCRRETLARLTPHRNRAVARATAQALLSASTR